MKRDKAIFTGYLWVWVLIPCLLAGGLLLMQCRAKGPNLQQVILISIDSCRPDRLSCYGYNKPTTPNIDEIAGQGVLFEQVISPTPITLPANISLLTGTIPLSHGVHDNQGGSLPDDRLTLAEILKANGFCTGAIIGTPVLGARFGIDQGFESFQEDFEEASITSSGPERRGDETTALAIQWLEQHKNEKFFLFLQYRDPHFEYRPPEPFASKFPGESFAPYLGEIAFVDHCIGGLVSKLKELGLYDSTLLIITGDHGEMLGEHGENQHFYFIYESALKVPLIVKLPGQNSRKPRRAAETVGLIDVAPTICALLDIPIPQPVEGLSLVPLLKGKELPIKDRYFYIESLIPTYLGANALLGIHTKEWKYIRTTRPELYYLKNDPEEKINLVNTRPEEERIYKGVLEKILEEHASVSPGSPAVPGPSRLAQDSFQSLTGTGYAAAQVTPQAFSVAPDKPDPKDLIEIQEGLQRVRQYKFEKKIPEAKQLLEDLERQKPHFSVYDHLGEIALEENNLAQARTYFMRSMEFNGNGYHANLNMGALLTRAGKFAEAALYFKRAVESRPSDIKALRNLGIVLERTGKLIEASNYFFEVLMLDPRDTIALNHLGNAKLAEGSPQEAVRFFLESLKVNRNQPLILGQLAQIKIINPSDHFYNPGEAVSLAQDACRLTGFNHPELLCILVSAYTAAGQTQEAVKTAELALKVSRTAGKTNLAQQLLRQLQTLRKHP